EIVEASSATSPHTELYAGSTPYTTAWDFYYKGRFDEAKKVFAEMATAAPDKADGFEGLGYIALHKGDLDEADRQFTKAVANEPQRAHTIEGLGYVRYRQRRHVEARALFEKIVGQPEVGDDVPQLLERLRKPGPNVVLIVVDGLRPDAIAAAPAKHIQEMM